MLIEAVVGRVRNPGGSELCCLMYIPYPYDTLCNLFSNYDIMNELSDWI